MTSERPPSCRPLLFALRSLRSFVAPAFISANRRQSADPFCLLSYVSTANIRYYSVLLGIIRYYAILLRENSPSPLAPALPPCHPHPPFEDGLARFDRFCEERGLKSTSRCGTLQGWFVRAAGVARETRGCLDRGGSSHRTHRRNELVTQRKTWMVWRLYDEHEID